MSKEDIINYVMTTPGNPNRAVLIGMLDSITGASEETTILTEESVTTQVYEDSSYAGGNLAYSELIDADTIYVTFEGEKYTCQKRTALSPGGEGYEYGASIDAKSGLPDFSQFPFGIISSVFKGNVMSGFFTETAGTYQIKIEVPQEDGSSTNEWSTAHIEFTVNGTGNCLIYTSNLSHNNLVSVKHSVWNSGDTTQTVGLTIPLYNNYHLLDNRCFDMVDLENCTTSGEITQTDDGFVIRGDGAIQLKAKPDK